MARPRRLSEAQSLDTGISGVYAIYRTGDPSKAYIGSSQCIRKRIGQHRRKLRNGSHGNYRLRAIFKTFGEGDLRFVILNETSDVKEARELEQAMIDFTPSSRLYNLDNQVYGR